jgi:small subunit ribosomal protein S20
MPHIPVHPSAEKRQRQNLKRAERNRAIKSQVHTALKDAGDAIAGKDAAAASEGLKQATKVLFRAVGKGTVHRNTASRKISRLAKRLHKAHAAAKA